MYFLQQKSRLYLLQFFRKSCTKMCLDLVLNAENQPLDRQFPRIYRVFWWKCSVINPKLLFAGLFWKKCINKKSSFGCYRGALTLFLCFHFNWSLDWTYITLGLGFHFSCSLDKLGCLRWMTFLVLSVPSQVRRASDGVFFESLLCLLDGLRVR